jgi:recombination protein RecT
MPTAQKKADPIATAMAVLQQQLGAGVAAKYNAAKVLDTLKWQTEKVFVQQIFQRSEFLCTTLLGAPNTLLSALQTAASLGLTLDPTQGLAFLVPQRPKFDLPFEVILKVSYKGMEQTVLRSGTVTAITTELVYENDTFDYGSNIDGPYLAFKMARGERGALQGGFCLARYANGERHVEYVPVKDLEAIEAAANKAAGTNGSPAWHGPFIDEMRKKSIVRRAAKHWPTTPTLQRLVNTLDAEAPIQFNQETMDAECVEVFGDTEVNKLMDTLSAIPPEQAAKWLHLKAVSDGFTDIRSVPRARFDDYRQQLATRLKLVMDKKAEAAEHAP